MKMIDDWKRILKRAWSVRLMVLAAILSGVEVCLSFLGGIPGIAQGVFAAIAGLVSMTALAARLIAQQSMQKVEDGSKD